jgi:zinc transport system ATP-binding protein
MAEAAITVTNVSKAVAGRQLLRDISFTVEAQSLVSLIGPNGAGKSTLVKIMLGLDPHHEGTVTFADNERVQYIPQINYSDKHQLPLSVHEYLSIGATPLYSGTSVTADFTKALEHVGVDASKLKQSFASLSGGERQRVAIARALLTDPTILVLDEPLAAVDYASRQGLYELIRHLQQDHKMTVLLVSHDIESVVALSDKVLCLNQTLHDDCHPEELTKDGIAKIMHHHC